ncbi:Ser/Thr protein phosphatase family protein [Chlamydia pneumoniae LPCoLN]|uniref:UDP-2,3-diacylglucosamine diphosphatase LpxG n=1 Tax=Chlamydia pneumoniae TaxID=83558 RepID=UPI0001BD9E26|nr:UDP-2,3-diacylglucosamine diphosphatase LpxG [Chlamydia pneumoniae]ACZ33556.1 Ser/Thr protein phosphatase family protein [Chlamydia pneumoniae LPCoLN]ETR80484.1 phosphohydrolase [Chlamydia pneumoniae B21]
MLISISLATLPILAFSWASFIEPNWLRTTAIPWRLPKKHAHLHGLRIAQISDLHFHKRVPEKFLNKVSKSIKNFSPDLIVFCGDLLCRARLEDKERLETFLNTLEAPLGAFAILGNHDYSSYISRNTKGEITCIPEEKSRPIQRAIIAVMQGLFSSPSYRYDPNLTPQEPHPDLLKLLKNTPLTLLHNTTHVIPNTLNIVGLGDLFARQFHPEQAFKNYDPSLPGLLLSHNPDGITRLQQYPGDFVLSGHSHGPQVTLSWPKFARKFFERLSGLENPYLARGYFVTKEGKQLYVNRGLGGLKRIRFCSPPEICYITCSYD